MGAGSQRKGLSLIWDAWHLRPSLGDPRGDFQEASEMSNFTNKNKFKRQIVCFGSKNCNSGYMDFSRIPNSVLIKGERNGF